MSIDPNNERLLEVEAEGNATLSESNAAFDSAIKNNTTTQTELLDKIDANKAQTEAALKEQSDLAIQKIEQNKELAQKDYQKEQRGAYVDWKKQSDPYGVHAEQMAANGLTNTGYAESSQVAMYTAYQNRIATAREAYTRAVVSYDTAIAEAKATNSVALAEIASKALEQSLNIAVRFAMQNNSLLVQKATNAATIKHNNRADYMDVYKLLQDEEQHNETIAEQTRQFNESLKEEQRQFNIANGTATIDGATIEGGTISHDKKSGEELVSPVLKDWAENVMYGFDATTYEEANAFLRQYGSPDFNLMTKNEWARRKAAYERTGVGDYHVSANKSYQDYLKTAVHYALLGMY